MSYQCYVYTPERSESDFLRNTILKLAHEKTTPTDIFESDFSNVTTQNVQYLNTSGVVTVDYNVSIGYNRKEKYEEWNKALGRVETKERQVTDWQPYSGSYTSTYLSAYVECKNSTDEASGKFVASAIGSCNKKSITFYDDNNTDEILYEEVTNDDMQNAMDILHARGRIQCSSHLPGDTYKDFSGNSRISNKKSSIHIAPLHTLTYIYRGEEYTSKAFSFGRYNEIAKMPDASGEYKKELNIRTKFFGYASIALALLSCILSLAVPVAAVVWIGFILSLASTALFIVARKFIEKDMDKRIKAIKISEANKLLEKLGLSPISESDTIDVVKE